MNKIMWHNGNIITLNDQQPHAEAVVVEDGIITFVGRTQDAQQKIDSDCQIIDLNHKTMLPGFYDAHSHFTQCGALYASTVDLSPAPTGTMNHWKDCFAALKESLASLPPEKWLIGRGFEDKLKPRDMKLDRFALDTISDQRPVIIAHNSGHLFYVNSEALRAIGYHADTEQPPGGHIQKDPVSGDCSGILEGTAAWPIHQYLANINEAMQIKAIVTASEIYAQQGITTVNEGEALQPWQYTAFMHAASHDAFPLQATINPRYEKRSIAQSYIDKMPDSCHVKGIKLIVDGSFQVESAYLTTPYLSDPHNFGAPRLTQEQLDAIALEAYENGIQIFAHCNGDMAVEMFLSALEKAFQVYPTTTLRPVIVHAQLMSPKQLERAKALGAIPSFFMAHVYYDGDAFCNTYIGRERGETMNPAGWADGLGMRYTFHCDTPVLPQNPFSCIYAATTRKCQSNDTIGSQQKVSRLHALKACSLWSAYQFFDEDRKGSIEAGKQADLIIVDQDVLHCTEEELLHTTVLETIVAGKSIYKKNQE